MPSSGIRNRYLIAAASGLGVCTAMVAALLLKDNSLQPWAAGAAIACLLVMRGAWRCPACRRPLAAFPQRLHHCKNCGVEFNS